MKRFLLIIGLTCALFVTATGGEIPSVPIAPPPTGGAAMSGTPSVDGNIPTVDSSLSVSAVDLIQTFISLLSV